MTPRAAVQIRSALALAAFLLLVPSTGSLDAYRAAAPAPFPQTDVPTRRDGDPAGFARGWTNNLIAKEPMGSGTQDGGLVGLYVIGADTPEPGVFRHITGIGLGPDGTLFVVDGLTHTVQRFSAKGEHLASWGGGGIADGRLAFPGGLAVAADGTIWVHDTGNNRLQHFLADGTLLGTLALPGDPPDGWAHTDPLAVPQAVAVASDGSLVVTYWRGAQIRLARHSGSGWDRDWAANAYDDVVSLAAGGDRVFVGGHGRVDVVDLSGRPVARWGEDIETASGIAVGEAGDLFVADADAGRVRRFHPDGTPVEDEPSLSWSPVRKIAARSTGQLAFGGPDRVEVRSAEGTPSAWGERDASPGDPVGVAALDGGLLAVGDRSGAVRFFTELGEPAGVAQPPVAELIELAGSADVATVLPSSSWSAWGVRSDGSLAGSRSLPPNAGGYAGLDTDSGGGLVLADGDSTVVRLDRNDAAISVWTGTEHPVGAFQSASDVATLADGYAVAEAERVRIVGADGGFRSEWPIPDAGATSDAPRRWITGVHGGATYVSDKAALYEAFGDGVPLRPPGLGGWVSGLGSGPGRIYASEERRGVHVLGEADGPWVIRAYGNRWLSGPALAAWTEEAIVYDWQDGPPADGVPPDRFSVSALRTVTLPGGATQFTLEADGGARLWVGEHLAIDAWGGSASGKATVEVPAGPVPIALEYNDPGGRAAVNLSWVVVAETPGGRTFLPHANVSRGGQ